MFNPLAFGIYDCHFRQGDLLTHTHARTPKSPPARHQMGLSSALSRPTPHNCEPTQRAPPMSSLVAQVERHRWSVELLTHFGLCSTCTSSCSTSHQLFQRDYSELYAIKGTEACSHISMGQKLAQMLIERLHEACLNPDTQATLPVVHGCLTGSEDPRTALPFLDAYVLVR